MLCDLPFDVLDAVVARLPLLDTMSLILSCKTMRTLTFDRACQAKANMDTKRAMWDIGPPPCLGDFPERRVHVFTSEWARSDFDVTQARHCFNHDIDWIDQIDPKQLVLIATGPRADTDETVRKLVQWMPEECKRVVTLWVQSDMRTRHALNTTCASICDEHLLPFCRAQGLSIYECDSITDAGVACFTQITRLMVDECRSIQGECLDALVTRWSLCRVNWWYYKSEPRELSPTLSPMIKPLIASGALRVTCRRCTRPNKTQEEAYTVD
jgi:hypothetical protein